MEVKCKKCGHSWNYRGKSTTGNTRCSECRGLVIVNHDLYLKYVNNNNKKHSKSQREWEKNNPDKTRLAQYKWREKNPNYYKTDKWRKWKRNYDKLYRINLKFEAFKMVGRGKVECCKCQFNVIGALQINHLKKKPKSEIGTPRSFLRKIVDGIRSIDDLDLRCANCNLLYEYERGRFKGNTNWTKYRQKAIDILGGKCEKCDIVDIRILQVNHKFGGGNKDRKNRSYPKRIFVDIVHGKDLEKYNVLCANHNRLFQVNL